MAQREQTALAERGNAVLNSTLDRFLKLVKSRAPSLAMLHPENGALIHVKLDNVSPVIQVLSINRGIVRSAAGVCHIQATQPSVVP